ncbi:Disease resistance protein RPP13 [Forsythia ovata]|uniref:Disease resistance protein RPP13 n=1 Tax=Forsythia ovata TaxID=205694 RepID=A0ABD1WSI2_9LAMI
MEIVVQQQTEPEELVIRTRDSAYEVEYVINSFPPFWYLAMRLPQLIEKIKLIRMAIQEMKNNIDETGMPKVAKYPSEQVSLQSKETRVLEDVVVGYENETAEISEQLVRGPDQLQIISIFGMPGLGKTTLAKKLYNDPSIVYHFDKRAWCVVSQTYNKRNMLIDILRSMSHLKRETITKMDDESLAQNLYKSLKGTRYLIVIDDIWDSESWDDLKRYFPDDGTRSRVIFTTRNKEVGLKASPHSVVNALPFLSKEECWELLQCKVFQKEYCPQELLEVGKEIAGNCQGLPLTVIVIAAVLANMEKEKQLWLDVARRLSSYISENPNECIHILELSYKHLPMHLKPCFLYFGTFEEDTEIPVRKLISLWVAEGFIKKEGQESLENVAEEYLMVLIDRSLVFVAERRSDGGVKTCVIHDLMRDMCLRIAEEENFLKAIEE